ncbi:hypothetical protein [Paracoccus aerodenitrificans]|uniref:hypothetical protein n=1 Tax=Paracoccus aerodenitrificans TaxID=3017781 RepID=UPI0022F0D3C3|nr:hypothetical protein [Paracoccus aerodenitrificans]WBU65484.1 hypothetical protein PAE61_08725 [Paracoccus aerodenitrificans]
MPRLVRLYLVNIFFGFVLAVIFTAALIGLNVANLRHLVMSVSSGWVAVVMLVLFHSILFAGVQFAIAVMRMAEKPGGPGSGRRQPVMRNPIRVPVRAGVSRARIDPGTAHNP